eukprot:m.67176 g.67176  ORF g.67176 m.67176 type:complete len:303 (-) comp11868_c0_seq1:316-1224(-)
MQHESQSFQSIALLEPKLRVDDFNEIEKCSASWAKVQAFLRKSTQKNERWIKSLGSLVRGKPSGCFVVTSATDRSFHSGGNNSLFLFEQCGSMLQMRCSKRSCKSAVREATPYILQENYTQHISEQSDEDRTPQCQLCNSFMIPNVHVKGSGEGKMSQRGRTRYENWLRGLPEDSKLTVLELGSGEERGEILDDLIENCSFGFRNSKHIIVDPMVQTNGGGPRNGKTMSIQGDPKTIIPQLDMDASKLHRIRISMEIDRKQMDNEDPPVPPPRSSLLSFLQICDIDFAQARTLRDSCNSDQV